MKTKKQPENNSNLKPPEPVDKALNYVKTLFNDDTFLCCTDYSFLSFNNATKYINRNFNFFSLTIFKRDNQIHFVINDEVNVTNEFSNKPEYSFSVVNSFNKEDEVIFKKITEKIKNIVLGLNQNVKKQIQIIQKKFLIEHESMNFKDCL